MKRVPTYKINGEIVNKETIILSLTLRLIAGLCAILLFAGVSPLSLAEAFGYAAVLLLVFTAKTLVVSVDSK